MYHQILVADEDQKCQQILWRNNSNENIRTYKLKTVTYGLALASFLALDIASRGTDPKCLPDCILWWQGPPWLRLETSSWPKAEFRFNEASDELKVEQKSDSTFNLFTHTSNNVIHDLFEHYSSLTKETKTAEETIIHWVQGIYFQEEIQSIKKQISPTPKSPLRSFHPFIDEHGILRVGGRLQNSQFRFNSKHPIILPFQHTISEFLIKEQHIAHLHAGPTLLAHVPRQSP
ncbi:uncharacterized protein TNCV_619421 [Trichonephila clavipes]|uniref:Uncharacterized protein n=1 Tax=Trichonephila clavipes TaxID=2585209 RepID=A0A8X6RXM8_TRICX|nr:uncharacterized protein TNCV_619421 [Trichonephila clavipes]